MENKEEYPDPEIKDQGQDIELGIELVVEDNVEYMEVTIPEKGKTLSKESLNSNKEETKVEEFMSDEDVPFLPTKYYIAIYLGIAVWFVVLLGLTIEFEDKAYRIFYKKGITYFLIIMAACGNGYWKVKYDIKTNYSRKINHVLFWSIPFIIDLIIEIEENVISVMWNVFFAMFGLILFMKPIRYADCTGLLNYAFKAIDRPEDRPNTLKWLIWQAVGVGVTILPFSALWTYWEYQVAVIPIMIVTFGDGLAEPVGVKFGKHKYKVKGLCTEQEYTRSLEGSSMVFLVSVIMLIIMYDEMIWQELVANLLLIPVAATISEAIAPHTLDNPIIITVVSSLLSIVHWITLVSRKDN